MRSLRTRNPSKKTQFTPCYLHLSFKSAWHAAFFPRIADWRPLHRTHRCACPGAHLRLIQSTLVPCSSRAPTTPTRQMNCCSTRPLRTMRSACRQNFPGAPAPPPQHARQSMRNVRPLAFLLSRALLAAPFVRRTSFEQPPLASFRRGDGRVSAAALSAYRADARNLGRIPRAVLLSSAHDVVVYMRARVANMAREPEAGLEAAAMDVIR